MIRPDLHLSPSFLAWLAPYLAVFSRRTRPTASALAVGALLAVGPRTVTNCQRRFNSGSPALSVLSLRFQDP